MPLPWLPGQVMVQGLSSQGSVRRCVERIRVIGHVVLPGWVPCVPWCGRLIRTWACYSEPGQYRPRTEQAVHVWDSWLMCGTGRPRAGGGGPTPGSPHRARTRYAEPGQCRPRTEQAARVWDSRLMCGTGRPRVGGGGPTPGSPHRARTRYAEPGPSCPHVDPLFRAWAIPPTCGIGGPRAEQVVRVRDAREPESLSHAANP